MLEITDVMPFLLERELIGTRAVVDGGLRIVDLSRRNRVFVVTADGEPGFVVKQPASADGAGVRHEAMVLQRLRAADRRLATRLPVPVWNDAATGILVLEAARDAQPLRDRHARGRFSREPAAQSGRTLALLHATAPAVLGEHVSPLDPTWALHLHRPSLRTASELLTSAASELVRAIQQSEELCAALDELHASLRDDAVVHGDVRWDNILSARPPGSMPARRSRMLLVDWESAGRGDPCLDLGAFFGEYLHAWVRSIPIADAADPGRLLAHARLPLATMRPALSAFWLQYVRHSAGVTHAELGLLLRRSAACAAVRVLTSAFEESLSHYELPASARLALQLSLNILRRPDEATARLLGIDATWTRA